MQGHTSRNQGHIKHELLRCGGVSWNAVILQRTEEVVVDNQLNMNTQCKAVLNRMNSILGYIGGEKSSSKREVVLPLYISLSSETILEHCVQTSRRILKNWKGFRRELQE